MLADNAAGTVFDLGARAATPARSLLGEVAECAGASGDLPAVLDWTDAGVAAELPGVTTFRAPAGERLPYLDSSVAVVVVDEMHDGREAARVASQRVITIGDTKQSPGASTIVSVDTPRRWQRRGTARARACGNRCRLLGRSERRRGLAGGAGRRCARRRCRAAFR